MSDYPLDWTISNLGAHLTETKERVGDGNAIPYSVSKVLGIVPQSEKFNKRVASSDISNYKVIRKGDFAYDPMLLWDGSINRMLREGKGAVSPAYVTFRVASDSLDADYLLHLLKASTTKNFYKSISKGTNVRRQKAEFGDFAGGEFGFPPLPEQKKIAEILSGIDNVISKKNIRNEKQKTTADLILDSALSNAEYRQAPLSEIALLERGKFSHRPRNDPAFYGGEYPFIQTGDIPKSGIRICEHKQTLNEKGLQVSRQFPRGTIVITIAATIGEVGILSYPACFPDSLVGITPKTEACDPVFLLLSLRRLKDKLLQMAPQSAQSNLNLEILGKLLLPLPPLNEQRQIARVICCEDSRASAESSGISKLQHMKKAVASDLLSGRKRVSI